MTMQDYEDARKLITDTGGGDFSGEKPEELIEKAEAALGLRFPSTYRRFLGDFGCGDIAGEEFYGIVDENFEAASIPNGIWLTLDSRQSEGLSENFVIIGADGDGTCNAIDTAQTDTTDEYPVVLLTIALNPVEQLASSFGSFLKKNVIFGLEMEAEDVED
jgi:antitoxin YobK